MLDVKVIGERIRELRQGAGLTQGELAGELSVSFQAVSNWERGIAPPDIENMVRIAERFCTTVDDLLHKKRERLYLGIDGGGTKTEFAVVSEDGYVLKRILKGGSNPNDIGYRKMAQMILGTIGELVTEFPSIKAVFCGISGISGGNNSTRLVSDVKKSFPNLTCDARTDAYNLFAMDESADMVVISGTGSVVFVKSDDGLTRLGGWGYLLDSAGSAYDMGRDAIAATLGEEDRGEAPSLLATKVREKLGARSAWDSINAIYEGGKAYIADFSGAVFAAYSEGDEKAIAIVDKSAKALSELLNLGVSRYGVEKRALARGGIFEHHAEIMLKHISKYTDVTLNVVGLPPIYGAARLARAMDGKVPDEFYDSFAKTYGGMRK